MRLPFAGSMRRALFQAAGSSAVPIRHRVPLLRRLGLQGVNDAALGHGVTFSNPGSVTMGPSCFINNQVYFDAGPVVLGRSVTVGPRTMFITANHSLGPADHRAGDGNHCGITVGDGSWIGAGVIVLPGVTIGPGCVIGAGAVVVTDCEAHGIYTGVPARRLRDLDPGVPSGRGAREL